MDQLITIEESQTLLINQQSKVLEKEDVEVIKFGFGQSPFLPPEPVMERLRSAVDRKDYTSVQGLEELRSSIAEFHRYQNGITSNADDVFVAPGSKILLWSIMASYTELDVLIPAPAWVSYQPQVKLLRHNALAIETSFENRWRVTPGAILKCLASKKHKDTLMILNYPGNPDGLSYSEDEIKEIASLARKHNILVIADEIYGLLSHGAYHCSFASYYPEKTITTTGLSKWCGAGGWRLGAAICSPGISAEMKKTMIGIGSETYSCAPTPVQMAAITAYQNQGFIDDYLKDQNKILAEVASFVFHGLKKTKVRIHKPEGGFYVFPDFSAYREGLAKRGIFTSQELTSTLLKETGVALLPASAFGMAEELLAARLAYVDFKPPVELKDFKFELHAEKVKKGINQLTSWLNAL